MNASPCLDLAVIMRSKLFPLAAIGAVVGLAGCEGLLLGSRDLASVPTEFTLEPAQATLYLAPEAGLDAVYPESIRFTLRPATQLPSTAVRWETSDASIAEVDSEGTVRAKATGSCVVRVRLEEASRSATASVEVKEGGRADVTLE